MMHFSLSLAALTFFSANVVAAPSLHSSLQTPLKAPEDSQKARPLHGRFLHITDFHPDRFYQVYSSTAKDAACHRGQGPAGIYGAEVSDCDSPIALINKTFEWLHQEWRDKVDFVVWTGDSARHDNDDDYPRSAEQVIGLNEFMVHKMFELFGKKNGDVDDDDPNNDYVIPIVPNLGNNDILPHNVITKGPNSWTRTYSQVWRQFIPEVQKHNFQQGGWFYVEVIPNKLAVFSLNSLYFFTSNAAADGCAIKSEPGYQQFEWLRIQLQFMRDRGMKAILTGHVPPVRQEAKTSWDETCWQKYTLWQRQFRDVILSSMYGHFNFDHFMLHDFEEIDRDTERGRMRYLHTDESDIAADDDDEIHAAVKPDYFVQLRDQWSELPEPPKSLDWPGDDLTEMKKKKKKHGKKVKKFLKKIGGPFAERYAHTFVAASMVPNLYPAFRVFEYNTTGLENKDGSLSEVVPPPVVPYPDDPADIEKKKKHKKYKFVVPDGPSKSSPPGPAYSPQTLTLLKYTQFFANLTHINNDFHSSEESGSDLGSLKWNEGKHKGKKPHDKDHEPNPKKFKFGLHYDTRDDGVYQLQDLTMPNLLNLARRIGDFVPEEDESIDGQVDHEDEDIGSDEVESEKKKRKHKKKKGGKKKHQKENEAWWAFIRRAYVETMGPEELEDEFGR